MFDVDGFARWMADVRDLGLPERCAVLAGVGPVRSLRVLEYLRTGVPGIHVPDHLERRMRGVPSDRVAAEGIRVCVETIEALREVPGVAGVHLMAFGYERGVPDILAAAGFSPDRAPAHDAPTRALSAVPGEG